MKIDLLEKIQALLAQADSTEFEAEAEAFYAKAQSLMLENAIDEQTVRAQAAAGRTGPIEQPTSRTLHYSTDPRNIPGKRQILRAVCRSNRIKFIYQEGADKQHYSPRAPYARSQWSCVIVGFASDLDYVETLFASLLLQSAHEARRQGYRTSRELTAFMVGYGETVERRLMEFNQKFESGAEPSKALALRDRSRDVEAEFHRLYPRTSKMKVQGGRDYRAQMHGRERGNYADVSGGRRNLGSTRQLGR